MDELSLLYQLADDSPLRGADNWAAPALLDSHFTDTVCADCRRRRGTPGLVPYDPAFAAEQQRRWEMDSMEEANWLYGEN